MRTYFDCVPCAIRQVIDSMRMTTDDETIQEQILREALRMAWQMDFSESPPARAQRIHRMIRKRTGVRDPYYDLKQRYNQLVLGMYPELKKCIEESADPLGTAVRLAIAGNIIDFGVASSVSEEQVRQTIAQALDQDLDTEGLNAFTQAVNRAESILYLGDNAGEIVLDRLLIEQLPETKITFVVKGGPILNDVLSEDAQQTGLTEIVEVIDNGHDAPGTVLQNCSEAFRERFEQTGMVIAKGQGNFETLNDADRDIFFLLKAKCTMIARHLGCEIGTPMIFQSRAEAAKQSSNRKEQ